MKKLNITKEAFEKSKYFTEKYGKLEYVSESGKLFKTEKGKIIKFKESAKKESPKKVNESTFLGDAEAILDKAYATACNELESLGIKYDSTGDNTIFFDDPVAKKTYVFTFDLRECDEYEGESTKNESYSRGCSRRALKELKSALGTIEVMLADDKENLTTVLPQEFERMLNVAKMKIQRALERQSQMKGRGIEKVNEAIPKTLKDIPKEQAEKLIQKHLRAGTGEWESSPGYSDFIYEIGGGRYKLIRPGFGGRYETGIVSM